MPQERAKVKRSDTKAVNLLGTLADCDGMLTFQTKIIRGWRDEAEDRRKRPMIRFDTASAAGSEDAATAPSTSGHNWDFRSRRSKIGMHIDMW